MNPVQSRLWARSKAAFKFCVALAHGVPFRRQQRADSSASDPRRILLMNGAHIGDVIVATSLLPVLRAAFPSAEIGFIVGSWAEAIVKNHPDVQHVHVVDHWLLNRASMSIWRKIVHYLATRRKALRTIRALHYDVALSLFTHQPDFLNLAAAASIPERVGFSKSVLSPLATRLVDEPTNAFATQGERLATTLQALPISKDLLARRRPSLPPDEASAVREVCSLLKVDDLASRPYRVVHMGTGALHREMPLSFWRSLAQLLCDDHVLLFTGHGARENDHINKTIVGLPNCINACGKLTWMGFVTAVRHADMLYGVESMAGHVAAAVGTRCAVIYSGTAGVPRWRPEGEECIVFTNHVPCAPCGLVQGCAEMTCLKKIVPADLVRLG